MKPKVIAFYLPQYHRIPENDEWWGEGFTDWESAKKSKPLFPGHNQPRIPANNNYYNLLDKETMEWQAKLAKKAGVYGFCIYHYWFGEKQLLEKPAENLLKWKDIDVHYCFSWANESWIRSWSKFSGNAWINNLKEVKRNTSGMLMEQKYGNEEEWKRHFLYLLPFFQDNRYIKKDNKPVFVIYIPSAIKRLKEMMECWKQMAVENGFAGIYFIGTNRGEQKRQKLDGELQYEPNYTMFREKNICSAFGWKWKQWREYFLKKNIIFPEIFSYKKALRLIAERERAKDVYPGCFVDFDSSPRKGNRAIIFWGAHPKRFQECFCRLYARCQNEKTEFIFLTAWNEWGEGACLEPDTRHGVRYLEAVRRTVKEFSRG